MPGDELGQQQVGEQPAAAEDEQVVGGELDLADQVAGDDDGAPLRITVDRDELRVTVDNPLPALTGVVGRTGSGVRGLHERAAVLGGTAHTGPVDNGWRVAVRLPLTGEA